MRDDDMERRLNQTRPSTYISVAWQILHRILEQGHCRIGRGVGRGEIMDAPQGRSRGVWQLDQLLDAVLRNSVTAASSTHGRLESIKLVTKNTLFTHHGFRELAGLAVDRILGVQDRCHDVWLLRAPDAVVAAAALAQAGELLQGCVAVVELLPAQRHCKVARHFQPLQFCFGFRFRVFIDALV